VDAAGGAGGGQTQDDLARAALEALAQLPPDGGELRAAGGGSTGAGRAPEDGAPPARAEAGGGPGSQRRPDRAAPPRPRAPQDEAARAQIGGRSHAAAFRRMQDKVVLSEAVGAAAADLVNDSVDDGWRRSRSRSRWSGCWQRSRCGAERSEHRTNGRDRRSHRVRGSARVSSRQVPWEGALERGVSAPAG